MIKLIKKATRWYFKKASENYALVPSGMLPCNPNL